MATTTKKSKKSETTVKVTKITPKATKKEKKEKVIQEVTPINKDALMEQVISKREIKYVYPEDCIDTLARKKFRQQVRNKIHALENRLFKINDPSSKEYKKTLKELNAYKSQTVKPNVAV